MSRPGGVYTRAVNLAKVDSFAELRKEGFTPYALGPVYVYAEVGWDLVQHFARDKDPKCPEIFSANMHFDRPVLARCEAWNNILDIMDTPSFQWFKKWMMGQNFVNRDKHKYFETRHFFAPILDPIILDNKRLGVPETLDTFCCSGRRAMMKPVANNTKPEDTLRYVDFETLPPDEDVVVRANAALRIVGES
jgi:hypothetical protein